MSLWKLLTARWGAGAGETDQVRIDGATNALDSIMHAHYEIHAGESYTYKEAVDLANGAVRDIQITTPNTTKWAHLFFSLSTESELDWTLYENVTINVPGAAYVPPNANRNSGNVSALTIAFIDNINIANANADTAVAGATLLYHGISGAGKDAGSYDHVSEIILEQNQDYTVRFVANAAGHVSYKLEWYERTALH